MRHDRGGAGRRTGRARAVLLAVALVGAGLAVVSMGPGGSPSAAADAGCSKYADPNGNDANNGTTPALAKKSPIALLNSLAPGQVGCLTDGATFTLGGGEAVTAASGTPGLPITLRPATPGARVTISALTGFWFQPAGHDLILKDLNIRRHGGGSGSLLLVDGDRVTLDGLDITYPNNICLDIGGDPRNGDTDPTEDFVLRNSRVHDCGSAYGPPHFENDSGVHGIYVQFLRDGADAGATNDGYSAIFEDNLIYANHNRGIQLYPDTDDALIRRNVFYGNGANVNIGSDSATIASERNTFTDNIISESTLDGLTPGGFVGDTNEVLGNLIGVANPANHVDGNCINNTAHPTALYAGPGFTHVNNIENQSPGFANPAAGDFTLAGNSPCLGKGPTSIQPVVVPPSDPTPVFARKWNTRAVAAGQSSSPESVDVSLDGSRVYVADADRDRIEQYDARGRFVRQWGSHGSGPGQFDRPVDVAVVGYDGDVYVADLNNHRIQEFTPNGVFVRQWTFAAGVGGAFTPHAVAYGTGGIFVADLANDRVLQFSLTGGLVQTIGSSGSGAGQLDGPGGLATDPSTGRLYVADLFNHRIQYFNFTGGVEGAWGTQGVGSGQFGLPVDVTVGPEKDNYRVYVVDYDNHRVQVFERPESGATPAQLAAWGSQGSLDGQFQNPESIAVVGHQRYVADGGNDRIQVFTTVPATGIGGSVTEQGSGAPIAEAQVAVLRTSDFSIVDKGVADAAGDYFVPGVPAGSYFLYVIDPTGEHPAGFHGAPTTVTVTANAPYVDADPTMAPTRGAIGGTVTTQGSGNAIPGAWAITLNAGTGQAATGAVADSAGNFRVDHLAPGNHRIALLDPAGAHRPEFYNDSPTFQGAASLAVTAGATTTANTALTPTTPPVGGSVLQGTVTEQGSGYGLSNIWVVALHASNYQMAAGAVTDATGHYSLNLNAGGYKLQFIDPAGLHAMEWHDNQPYYGITNAATATAPATVNAALTGTTGVIHGHVESQPLEGTWVIAIGPNGVAGSDVTNQDGDYGIGGLPPGTYRVTYLDSGDHTQRWFANASGYATATLLSVAGGQYVTVDP